MGIGTTTPSTAKLVIAGSVGNQGLDLSSTDQYANLRVIQNTNGVSDKDLYFGLGSGATSKMHLYSNNSELVSLTGGTNVGIGNTAPHAALQFGNVLTNRRIVLWEDTNNDHQYYGFGMNGNILRYQVAAPSQSHVFYAGVNATTSLELMRIQGDGKVGIGTANPTSKLQVVGLPVFTDNAAATAGGLTAGAFYRTSTGVLMVVF